jgi:selenocysteine lyase/cysteine desulfurase
VIQGLRGENNIDYFSSLNLIDIQTHENNLVKYCYEKLSEMKEVKINLQDLIFETNTPHYPMIKS